MLIPMFRISTVAATLSFAGLACSNSGLGTRACPQIQAELVRKFWLPEGPARAAAGWMQGNGASEVP